MKQPYVILFIALTVFNAYGQEAIAWQFPTGAGVYSSPTADENCIYVGSNDSCLYALNKKAERSNGHLKPTDNSGQHH